MPHATSLFRGSLRLGRGRGRPGIVVAAVAIGGMLVTFVTWRVLDRWERETLRGELRSQAESRARVLTASLARSTDVLHSIASLVAAADAQSETAPPAGISRSQFRRFVAGPLGRQPELRAIGWTPRVAHADRDAYEHAARADGLPAFRFLEWTADGQAVAARDRAEYFPVYYLEPAAANALAMGFELDSDPARGRALADAARTGRPTLVGPIRLVQEPANPLGFIVYLAFRGTPTSAQAEGPLLGYGSAVYRLQDLLAQTTTTTPGGESEDDALAFTLRDDTAGGDELFRSGQLTLGAPAEVAEAPVEWGGRRWTVSLGAGARYVAAHRGSESRLAAGGGAVITLLLTAYLWNLLRRRAEIERAVRERTEELRTEVGERRRAAEAAAAAERKYRGIFDNAVEGIFQTTPDGHYVSTNPALARIYGYDSAEQLVAALTNIADQLYVDPSRRAEFARRVQRDGVVTGFESQVYRRDGRIIWISENARAVHGLDGSAHYYEGMVVDVTERKLAEATLRQDRDALEAAVRDRTGALSAANEALQQEVAERRRAEDAAAAASRAKTAFLANMSHEIRTPMNAILGYAQLLGADAELPLRHRDAMSTVLSSGRHLLDLIDEVLDLSKIEAGHATLAPRAFSLPSLLREIVTLFSARCRQKGLRIDLHAAADDLPDACLADDGKLRQVLINLVGNAVKFTDSGGVTLGVARVDGTASDYQFDVADTGVGIRPEELEAIFEPFQQGADAAGGGTGLGLTIARGCIRLMSGRLGVASQPGRGTTFSFVLSLPAVPVPCGTSMQPLAPGAMRPGVSMLAPGVRVNSIIVDDTESGRMVLADMLRRIGCDVTAADDAESAVRAAEQRAFDIAFVDARMPRVGGVETGRRLAAVAARAGRPLVRIATSASALPHERDGYLAAGFDAFLPKPIDFVAVAWALSHVPGVTFTPPTPPPADSDERTVTSVTTTAPAAALAAGLRARIARAAQRCNATELRQCLAEAERAAPDAADLALLRDGLKTYDMDRIVAAMSDGEAIEDAAVEVCAE